MQPVTTQEEFIERWGNTGILSDEKIALVFKHVDAMIAKINLPYALVVHGQPGSGKTFLVNDIIALSKSQWKPLSQMYICDKSFNIHRALKLHTCHQYTDINAILTSEHMNRNKPAVGEMMADFMTNSMKRCSSKSTEKQNFGYRNLIIDVGDDYEYADLLVRIGNRFEIMSINLTSKL